jgi:hypothetical protein
MGWFPQQSSRCKNCITVLYDYDSNSILNAPMKTHSDKEKITAYSNPHADMIHAGLKPRLQKLDNEAPEALK